MSENAIPAGERWEGSIRPWSDLEISDVSEFVREGSEVRLKAARSRSSGEMSFPPSRVCPRTGVADMEPFETESTGTLYSHSTIHVSASRATPYTIGYVDFSCGLRVLAQVRWSKERSEACDLPVRLCADGDEWWAEPMAEGVS